MKVVLLISILLLLLALTFFVDVFAIINVGSWCSIGVAQVTEVCFIRASKKEQEQEKKLYDYCLEMN